MLVTRPELKQRRALVLFGRDPRQGPRVVACSREARRQGVCVGMPLPEAVVLLERPSVGSRPSAALQGPAARRFAARHTVSRSDDQLTQLGIWPHAPVEDRQTLEQLVPWAEAFSPLVGLDGSPTASGLLLDVTGVTARHGGEVPFVQQLHAQLQQRGYWGQLGLADTLGAAWALAHFGHTAASDNELTGTTASTSTNSDPDMQVDSPFLSSVTPASAQSPQPGIFIALPGQTPHALAALPVAGLRLSPTALAWLGELGVERIEQLRNLPRAGVSSRLGAEVLRRLDQALGRCAEMFAAHQPPLPFVAQWQTEHPTTRFEVIERVVEHLSHHLAEQLCSQQRGALQLRCCLSCDLQVVQRTDDDRGPRAKVVPVCLEVSLFQPTLHADYLWQLLRTQLESVRFPGPVAAVELQALVTVACSQRQSRLWDDETTVVQERQLATLIDRLSNRLGPQAICAARLRQGTLPETAYALNSAGRFRGFASSSECGPSSDTARCASSPATVDSPSPALADARAVPSGGARAVYRGRCVSPGSGLLGA